MSWWILFWSNLLMSSFSSLTEDSFHEVCPTVINHFPWHTSLAGKPCEGIQKAVRIHTKCCFQRNCKSQQAYKQAKPPLLMVHTSSLYSGKKPGKVHCCLVKRTEGEPQVDLSCRKHPWSVLMTSSSFFCICCTLPPILESPHRLWLPNTSQYFSLIWDSTKISTCWMVGLFIVIFNNELCNPVSLWQYLRKPYTIRQVFHKLQPIRMDTAMFIEHWVQLNKWALRWYWLPGR